MTEEARKAILKRQSDFRKKQQRKRNRQKEKKK